jgi:predicted transcriptional regulator of viral defense system
MQKLNLFSLEEKLSELQKKVFTPQDLVLFFGASKRAVEGFLSYNTTKNKIIRLRKGLYALKKAYVSLYLVANKIYQPSYISFETALSFYSLIPEIVYSMTSATPKPTREFEANGVAYSYHTIKKEAFTGYTLDTIEDNKVYIATPEKATADYCYFIFLRKRNWNDRFDKEKINIFRLRHYLKLFKKDQLLPFTKQYFPNL